MPLRYSYGASSGAASIRFSSLRWMRWGSMGDVFVEVRADGCKCHLNLGRWMITAIRQMSLEEFACGHNFEQWCDCVLECNCQPLPWVSSIQLHIDIRTPELSLTTQVRYVAKLCSTHVSLHISNKTMKLFVIIMLAILSASVSSFLPTPSKHNIFTSLNMDHRATAGKSKFVEKPVSSAKWRLSFGGVSQKGRLIPICTPIKIIIIPGKPNTLG